MGSPRRLVYERTLIIAAPLLGEEVKAVLTRRVLEDNRPLRDLTNDCDSELNLLPGTSLMVVRHLLANRRWQVDMRKPIHAPERMVLTAIPAIYARQAKGVEG